MTKSAIIRSGAVVELGLMVAEAAGQTGGVLPLGGNHGAQLGIVFGSAWCLHEAWPLTAGMLKWIKSLFDRPRG